MLFQNFMNTANCMIQHRQQWFFSLKPRYYVDAHRQKGGSGSRSVRGVGGVAGCGAGQRVVRVRVRVAGLVAHRDELLRVRSAHVKSTLP